MEQNTQHKIEVVSKRRCSSKLPHYIDWSKPMAYNRHTIQVLRKMRNRQFQQQKWKPLLANGCEQINQSNGGYAILWELDKVDRKIRTLQSEIYVLRQQLKIIKSDCVVTAVEKSKHKNNDSFSSTMADKNDAKMADQQNVIDKNKAN